MPDYYTQGPRTIADSTAEGRLKADISKRKKRKIIKQYSKKYY